MNSQVQIRTRFAPSPSGIMHVGNIRSALMSYLCAKEAGGDFVLRIEDTDQSRTSSLYLDAIYLILNMMQLYPDESPLIGGPYGPYTQSERTSVYQDYLNHFLEKKLIYRCFKTSEELEEERKKQIALKLPPRYERVILSEAEEKKYLEQQKPFIWRLKIREGKIVIEDKMKGAIHFDLSNFADCPITRQDGTFTFLFANFVDDIEMKISYVVRGEEHLSNTAIQAYMYEALSLSKPFYCHLPLICDSEGKKLSKRNFGFNIFDLLEEGFLPQAIINYIAIIGSNMKEEILSLTDMVEKKVFSEMRSSGFITYDINKLLWINSKWMQKIDILEFISILSMFKNYVTGYNDYSISENTDFLMAIKKESRTIKEFFYNTQLIMAPPLSSIIFDKEGMCIAEEAISVINYYYTNIPDNDNFKIFIKKRAQEANIMEKKIYQAIRKIIIGSEEGMSIWILLQYTDKNKVMTHISTMQCR
jgi:glutamyl-tRNA synthetase